MTVAPSHCPCARLEPSHALALTRLCLSHPVTPLLFSSLEAPCHGKHVCIKTPRSPRGLLRSRENPEPADSAEPHGPEWTSARRGLRLRLPGPGTARPLPGVASSSWARPPAPPAPPASPTHSLRPPRLHSLVCGRRSGFSSSSTHLPLEINKPHRDQSCVPIAIAAEAASPRGGYRDGNVTSETRMFTST